MNQPAPKPNRSWVEILLYALGGCLIGGVIVAMVGLFIIGLVLTFIGNSITDFLNTR
jgi:hypothetical protein